MATKPKKPTPAGAAAEGLKVIARSPIGIRRAGRHWGPAGETVSLADLTPDQLDALESDPGLVTVRVPFEAPADATGE